jgi:anti-anti-sigma factor
MLLEPFSPSPVRALVASVADFDDTVIALIFRHAEPWVAEAGLFVTVISVDGDIEGDTAAYLDYTLQQALLGGAPVCCDLGRTDFFGAAAVGVVMAALRRAAEADTALLLRGVHGMSAVVLKAVGLERGVIIP